MNTYAASKQKSGISKEPSEKKIVDMSSNSAATLLDSLRNKKDDPTDDTNYNYREMSFPLITNLRVKIIMIFGQYWPKTWWQNEIQIAYLFLKCKSTLSKKMDIVHILRDVESFNFYMQLRVQDSIVQLIQKETKYTIYLDQNERYRNVNVQDIKYEKNLWNIGKSQAKPIVGSRRKTTMIA